MSQQQSGIAKHGLGIDRNIKRDSGFGAPGAGSNPQDEASISRNHASIRRTDASSRQDHASTRPVHASIHRVHPSVRQDHASSRRVEASSRSIEASTWSVEASSCSIETRVETPEASDSWPLAFARPPPPSGPSFHTLIGFRHRGGDQI